MNFITKLLISTLAVFITAYLLPGVHLYNNDVFTAIVVAAVLAFLNAIIKPIMVILTIPVTIVSFGLFLLVINAFIILLTDKLIDGFSVDGFWWALLFSIVLSFINSVLESFGKTDKK